MNFIVGSPSSWSSCNTLSAATGTAAATGSLSPIPSSRSTGWQPTNSVRGQLVAERAQRAEHRRPDRGRGRRTSAVAERARRDLDARPPSPARRRRRARCRRGSASRRRRRGRTPGARRGCRSRRRARPPGTGAGSRWPTTAEPNPSSDREDVADAGDEHAITHRPPPSVRLDLVGREVQVAALPRPTGRRPGSSSTVTARCTSPSTSLTISATVADPVRRRNRSWASARRRRVERDLAARARRARRRSAPPSAPGSLHSGLGSSRRDRRPRRRPSRAATPSRRRHRLAAVDDRRRPRIGGSRLGLLVVGHRLHAQRRASRRSRCRRRSRRRSAAPRLG